ncbi:GerMN domain-containing protein [Paenibacillus sp. ACRRX]|uniref:GerMN domain-containing protein n=1 Tax=Paenibacillus sp. ACRRX TaxID=2918206 RepID=UPI001EF72DCE|nr:GerMN domain-containing protein [Paenibacillus sp. ACRRX]MCG7410146.1 GerMN domain-containing protein [Paenibacillus sp. ACRRX]
MNNSKLLTPHTNTFRRRLGVLACTLILSTGLAACGGEGAIDAPPPDVETQMLRQAEGQAVTDVNSTGQLTDDAAAQANMFVYLKDRHGYLAPIAYHWQAKDEAALAKTALEMLIDGGVYANKLPAGFKTTLPKGTRITNLSLKPEQKLAVVEFSDEFKNYEAVQERSILESIAWTLTSLPNVKEVQLWMNSKKLTEMPVDRTPVDTHITRSLGINLEKGESVNYLKSMPVMLYFTSLTEDGKSYYIPVTRLIEPSENPVEAALQQIIQGPQDKKAMSMVATEATKIKNIEHTKDTVTVDLVDSMFEKGDKVPADLLKSVVLSLTELPNVGKVQIRMNGAADIQGTDNKDYSKPVTRPIVNPMWKG